ncbi:MAG: DUF2271 domain-containing protein [Treponema sp.]|jgi:hypothetical protein|nr:DUF2271 domain-containing protein [Treponema sp.]
MKKIFLSFILMVFILANAAAQQAAAEVTFTFTRQNGSASNQFAVWIENSQGQHVKTLYATRWTANGGFSRRPASIPLWVKQSGLSGLSKAQVDAVSAATPGTGALAYTWDGTDARGAPAPAGIYTLVIEGTLRWENQVYYRAPIRLGGGPAAAQVNAEYTAGDRDATAERSMIGNVKVRVLR